MEKEGLLGASKGFGVQTYLMLTGCLIRKVCKCKIIWHLILAKEVLLLLVDCTNWFAILMLERVPALASPLAQFPHIPLCDQ